MVQDDSYVEANLDEITFSGNVSDDDEESDEKEEKAEEVEEVPESKELILETNEPEEADTAEEEKPQIIEVPHGDSHGSRKAGATHSPCSP